MKTLSLGFVTDLNKSYTLTIQNPKENLTAEQVTSAMQQMIEADVLAVPSGRIRTIKSAKYIDRFETVIIV